MIMPCSIGTKEQLAVVVPGNPRIQIQMNTVFLLKKTTTAKKLLHIPHILPHTSDCAKLLLIVQNDSVLFTEWDRKRSRRPMQRTPGPETTTHSEDDGHGPSEGILDRQPRRESNKIDFLDTPPNDPKQQEIQYSINIDSIVTGQGRNGRSSAKVVFKCLDRNARRTTASVPGHQETQVCRADDPEGSKEENEGIQGRPWAPTG